MENEVHETVEQRSSGHRHALHVVICDDHRTLREALRTYLLKQPLIESVELAANADEAVRLARTGADVLVLDVFLGGSASSLDVLEAVRNLGLHIAVLMLSAVEDTDLISRAMGLGAAGFCPKHAPANVLYDAIITVSGGEVFLPDTLVGPVLAALRERRQRDLDDKQLLMRLTPRERDVLRLLAHGHRGDEIGRRLGVSRNTVRTHLGSILEKLGVHSQVAAAALGRRLFGLQPGVDDVVTIAETDLTQKHR